jgi:hypothetical protein
MTNDASVVVHVTTDENNVYRTEFWRGGEWVFTIWRALDYDEYDMLEQVFGVEIMDGDAANENN